MKTRVLIIGFLFVIIVALMTAPVSALTTGTTALTGNPSAYVSITLNELTIPLTLSPSAPAVDSSLTATVSANKAFTVTVADNTGRTVPAELGYMGPYTIATTSYVTVGEIPLTDALQLLGTTSGTTSAVAIVPPITSTPQTLYSGSAAVTAQVLANQFTQQVEYADAILPGTETYRIDLLYTITAS